MPAAFAARTTSATLSGPPMLPGLIRTAATPASIAFTAREALKWMSAITGIALPATIVRSAATSGRPGTATRTISQPASTRRPICASVASASCVLVVVIDWTTTGAPAPIGTPPTEICRALAMRRAVYAGPRPFAAGPGRYAEHVTDPARRRLVGRDRELAAIAEALVAGADGL